MPPQKGVKQQKMKDPRDKRSKSVGSRGSPFTAHVGSRDRDGQGPYPL